MPLFKKKPKIQGPVPLREVQSLRNAGLSDKEIIKRLKDKGYDYNEIERALLQSIRGEITSTSARSEEMQSQSSSESPTFGDVFTSASKERQVGYDIERKATMPMQTSSAREEFQEDIEEFSDLFGSATSFETPVEGEETVSPEVTIEEIVEGVIGEKWAPIEKEIETLRKEQESIKKEISEMKIITTKIPTEESKGNISSKLEEIEGRLNELEPKISGLEKAFKQFLPTLTDNIRMLSQIVEKMKEKRSEETARYDFTERASE
ncbi:MAG: hypothetical protein QXJ96_00255 [Candidatus Aenigmatarchaeota archaeon]|nr:hypothetical protein [Candidatus Aenigmarchaeota archaeon]